MISFIIILITLNKGEEVEFSLSVGETIDFKCLDPLNVKHFQTTAEDLKVSQYIYSCSSQKEGH